MTASRAIVNGRLLLPDNDKPSPGVLRMQGDRIIAVGDIGPEHDDDIIDADGAIIAPGLVDLGVFSIDAGAFHFGGITRAALMPDQSPPLDYPARVRFAAQSGKPDFWVHPIGAATRNMDGKNMAELALMKDAGARAIATGREWIADSGTAFRIMQYCAMLDLPFITHAEDKGLTAGAVATSGEMATRLGLASAPVEAESIAIARDIALAEMADAHLHIRQVTSAKGLDLVRAAKDKGLRVTCGITPAHFQLSDLATAEFRTFARLSPPLRSEADRKACIDALVDGTIDVISSGHDPKGPEDKRLPFADAATGMAGAETLLPMTLLLVAEGKLSLGKALELVTRAPARILKAEAGELTAGAEADIMIFRTDTPWIVDSAKMTALAGNTPFDKLPVQGRVEQLFKGGRKIEL